jgi:5-hydroxyisourate hydrolase
MKRISTHILDTMCGRPAKGVPVTLARYQQGAWVRLSSAQTDQDGRCAQLLTGESDLAAGEYRITFDTASYFRAQGVEGLYPVVEITFQVRGGESHFHIPLLLSPNGYSTYRGS